MGKDEQGTSTNLRGVRRTEETLGIGATTDLHGSEGWDKTNQNFHDVLASLHGHHSKELSKKEKKRKKKERKLKNKGNMHDSNNAISTSNLVLPQNQVTSGHARKMRDAKDLSNKSKEDMAAIFGVLPQQFQFQKISAVSSSSVRTQALESQLSPTQTDPSKIINSKKTKKKNRSKQTAVATSSHVISDASEEEIANKNENKNRKRKRETEKDSKKKKSKKKNKSK